MYVCEQVKHVKIMLQTPNSVEAWQRFGITKFSVAWISNFDRNIGPDV